MATGTTGVTGTTGTTGAAGPAGPKSFVIKSRTTGATVETTVTAQSRDEALAQTVAAAGPGEEVDVMHVTEVLASIGPTGATGP